MSETGPPRPPQVTLAASLVILGSVSTVIAAYIRLSTLHTLASQDEVSGWFDAFPGRRVSLDDALRIVRVTTLVAAGCATAAAILGREVLHRSRAARVVLSVLAIVMFVTGRTTYGFLPAVVAAAVVVLWLKPARDWFDGVAPVARVAPAPRAVAPPSYPMVPQAPPVPTSVPPLHSMPSLPPQSRPGAVIGAAVLTWLCSSLVTLVAVGVILVVALDRSRVLSELHTQQPDLADRGFTDDQILTSCYEVAGLLIVWSVVASVFAVQLMRRRRWARVALLVSAGLSGGLLLVATLGSLFPAPLLAAAIATVVMLRRPEVARWL